MTVRPLTEGYVVKGGHNSGASQVQTRPAAPGAIQPQQTPREFIEALLRDMQMHRGPYSPTTKESELQDRIVVALRYLKTEFYI